MITVLPKEFDLKARRSLSWYLFVYSFAHSTFFSTLFIYFICFFITQFLLKNSLGGGNAVREKGEKKKKKEHPFRTRFVPFPLLRSLIRG